MLEPVLWNFKFLTLEHDQPNHWSCSPTEVLCHIAESLKIIVTLKGVIESGVYNKSIYLHLREKSVKMI